MARVLILGGGERALAFANALAGRGLAVRLVVEPDAAAETLGSLPAGAPGVDRPASCAAAPRAGAPVADGVELWRASARRLASLQGALAHVTVACWLFGDARAGDGVRALHGSLLEGFLRELLDSPARGFLYELPPEPASDDPGGSHEDPRAAGAALAAELTARHALGLGLVRADPVNAERWLGCALAEIERLLAGR
jgi:hypothetical protein